MEVLEVIAGPLLMVSVLMVLYGVSFIEETNGWSIISFVIGSVLFIVSLNGLSGVKESAELGNLEVVVIDSAETLLETVVYEICNGDTIRTVRTIIKK